MRFEVGQQVLLIKSSPGSFGIEELSTVTKITPKGNLRVENVDGLFKPLSEDSAILKLSLWSSITVTNNAEKISDFKRSLYVKTIKQAVQTAEISFEQAVEIGKIIKRSA